MNFCYLNDAKCRSNIFKVSTQSINRAVRTNANFLKSCHTESARELSTATGNSAGISRKNQMLSRVCYFIECKDFSDVRKVRRLFKTWTKVVTSRFTVDSHSNRISRVESEILKTKNWWVSQESRIECQLTFERHWYGIFIYSILARKRGCLGNRLSINLVSRRGQTVY